MTPFCNVTFFCQVMDNIVTKLGNCKLTKNQHLISSFRRKSTQNCKCLILSSFCKYNLNFYNVWKFYETSQFFVKLDAPGFES